MTRYARSLGAATLLAISAAAVEAPGAANRMSSATSDLVRTYSYVERSTPVVDIGDDRFLIVENGEAHVWDGRTRTISARKNTGSWNFKRAVAVGRKVLIAGQSASEGETAGEGAQARGEAMDLLVYDPDTDTGVPGKLTISRTEYQLVSLSENEVLVVGGRIPEPSGLKALASVELVSLSGAGKPRVETLPDMNSRMHRHSLVRLRDGRVLGIDRVGNSPELFDPRTRHWQKIKPACRTHISNGYASLLPDGRVLVDQQIWDPATGLWSCVSFSTKVNTYSPTLALNSHQILSRGTSGNETYILDMRNAQVHAGPQLHGSGNFGRAVRLSNGELHFFGLDYHRESSKQPPHAIEMVRLDTWDTVEAPPLAQPIAAIAAAKLGDGRILIAGDWGQQGEAGRHTFITTSSSREVLYGQRRVPGPQPQAFSLPDGSAVVVGGVESARGRTGAVSRISVQRWDPGARQWTAFQGFDIPIRDDRDESMLQRIALRGNGELIFFGTSDGLRARSATDAFAWDHKTNRQRRLGPMRKWRRGFTPLELADGRLAVIGGDTHANLIALEKDCTGCPDEYVSFGKIEAARSSEVYDFSTGKWQPGPYSAHPGGTAVRLADGRIVKVTVDEKTYPPLLEVSDRAFTRWTPVSVAPNERDKLRELGIAVTFGGRVIAVGNRVVVLTNHIGPDVPGLVWDADRDSWTVWRTPHLLSADQLFVIDDKTLFMAGFGPTTAIYGPAVLP